MKRWTEDHALAVAQKFCESTRAEIWTLFGAEIRGALIDSLIMDEVRIADSVDSPPFSAADLLTLREQVVAILADGAKPKHARHWKTRSFKVYE